MRILNRRCAPALSVSVLCLLVAPTVRAQTGPGETTVTSSTLTTYHLVNTINVTQQVDTFQVELKARMQGGAFLFDQTFNVALSDPTVQAAITQAKSVLTAAGAASFAGPTRLSSTQSLVSSIPTTVQTVVGTNITTAVTVYVGPQTIMVGSQRSQPWVITAGGVNYDSLTTTDIFRDQTVTTTNTFLTTQSYEIVGLTSPAGSGQLLFYPSSASTSLVFPHLTDGGPIDQKWKVTITFTNPNAGSEATVQVRFYDNNGAPLALDFGTGASATLNLTVPAGGTKSVTSAGASSDIRTGWGIAAANLPVTGIVLFQASKSGTPFWDVSALGGGSTYFYTSYAVPDLGVALANPNASGISVQMAIRDADGTSAGTWPFPLPAMGHTVFNLNDPKYGLNRATFTGTVTFTPVGDPPAPFAAWTLNFRDGQVSPLPPGEVVLPGPYERRPYDVYIKARQASAALVYESNPYPGGTSPDVIAGYIRSIGLIVTPGTALKAAYNPATNNVEISIGLVEAMGASDAAMAFVMAHMSAHGVLHFTGPPGSGPFLNDPEGLANAVGAGTLLKGAFDPSGVAEFFGRLMWAYAQGLTLDPALRAEFKIPDDPRFYVTKAWQSLSSGCLATGDLYETCQKARKYWHPGNPTTIP
jgi:hypothetical protein